MSLDTPLTSRLSVPVPCAQIAQFRREFPQAQLRFEVEVAVEGLAELAQVCTIFARAGLTLVSLKAGRGARALCVLEAGAETDSAALVALAEALAAQGGLERWVTQLIYPQP